MNYLHEYDVKGICYLQMCEQFHPGITSVTNFFTDLTNIPQMLYRKNRILINISTLYYHKQISQTSRGANNKDVMSRCPFGTGVSKTKRANS